MLQTKEQDKTSEEQLSEAELGRLLEKEFTIMIVKMSQISQKEWRHRLRRYKKCLTKRRFKEQTEMNNTINKMKNALEGINSGINEAGELKTELEDGLLEVSAVKRKKGKACINIQFRPRDTYRLKVSNGKRYSMQIGNQKKTGVTILISDKIGFKTKTVTGDKEGDYIKIKGSIQQEDIIIVIIYAPNIGAPHYIRQC